jgi:hypothetical protein
MKNQHSVSLVQLVRTLLWSSIWDDENLDEKYSINQVDSACLAKLEREFQEFVEAATSAIKEKRGYCKDLVKYFHGKTDCYQLEHDYILTRNHHGAGFWDGDWDKSIGEILTSATRFQPEIEAYVGDDGFVYF